MKILPDPATPLIHVYYGQIGNRRSGLKGFVSSPMKICVETAAASLRDTPCKFVRPSCYFISILNYEWILNTNEFQIKYFSHKWNMYYSPNRNDPSLCLFALALTDTFPHPFLIVRRNFGPQMITHPIAARLQQKTPWREISCSQEPHPQPPVAPLAIWFSEDLNSGGPTLCWEQDTAVIYDEADIRYAFCRATMTLAFLSWWTFLACLSSDTSYITFLVSFPQTAFHALFDYRSIYSYISRLISLVLSPVPIHHSLSIL